MRTNGMSNSSAPRTRRRTRCAGLAYGRCGNVRCRNRQRRDRRLVDEQRLGIGGDVLVDPVDVQHDAP